MFVLHSRKPFAATTSSDSLSRNTIPTKIPTEAAQKNSSIFWWMHFPFAHRRLRRRRLNRRLLSPCPTLPSTSNKFSERGYEATAFFSANFFVYRSSPSQER